MAYDDDDYNETKTKYVPSQYIMTFDDINLDK